MNSTQEAPKEPNDIRIGMSSRVRNVISYCNGLISDTTPSKPKFLKFSAVGGAIGKLVDVVEVLKCVNPGLYQTNKIATVSYQSINDRKEVVNQKLYPKFEVILSFEEPKDKNPENYQDKLPEEERKKMYEILNSRPQRPTPYREGGYQQRNNYNYRNNERYNEESYGQRRERGGRGRGGFNDERREGFRGGRGQGGFRARRGMGPQRGGRGFSRGGYSGPRRGGNNY